tara:strand:+ start:97 stop:294 length:198 start_codon:yes stop_codon:yes gene_type:complete
MSEILSLPRMAKQIGVTREWLLKQAIGGEIPCLKAGNRYLFNPTAVRSVLTEKASHLPTEVQYEE